MYIFLAMFSGLTVILSIIILGELNKRVGLIQTNFINFLAGTIGSIILVFIANELDLGLLGKLPAYLYITPLFVIGITMLNGIVINNLPAVYTTMLMFIGQLLTGIVIDFVRFGKFPVGDFIGGVIILLGLVFNSYVKDYNEEEKSSTV